MPSDDNDGEDSPEKCRERRRRRIEMRRLAIVSGANGPPSPEIESSVFIAKGKRVRTTTEMIDRLSPPPTPPSGEALEPPSPPASVVAPSCDFSDETPPVFGVMSVSGRSREMEDAISTRTNFCRPEISQRRPLHFFGVFDGHGGSQVAALCSDKMHVLLAEELTRVCNTQYTEGGYSAATLKEQAVPAVEVAEERWRKAIERCFERMDKECLTVCSCGNVGHLCGCQSMEVSLVGSTAVVAVVRHDYIVVANCGDSRAVLCRRGKAVPLSRDHKPDRPDELARIEASGGRVISINGARVAGILAMSRALGDKYLKPIVTSVPEISFTKRDPNDECLILASDGLWDVISSDLACEVASECLREGHPMVTSRDLNGRPHIEEDDNGALYPSRSALAAALLTRLALGRKSADNVSVIVVDLRRK